MTVSELKICIRKNIDSKCVDWTIIEEYISRLGENINDVIDEEDTFLSDLYPDVHNGYNAVKLTELFLRYGYDVSANNGFNGAACLHRLCFSFYDHYILHIAELLIDAGADCTIDIYNDSDSDDELSGVLKTIEWKSGDWMTGAFYSANIFEAYCEMVNRKIQNKPYKGIRSFRDVVGKTVNKVLRLSYKDGKGAEYLPNAFDGRLVFITDDGALTAEPYIAYMVNPYYLDGDFITEDVSWFYKDIIGAKIKGLRFASDSFAAINFENGKSISFINAYYDSEKEHKAGLCYLRNTGEVLKLHEKMVVQEFLFTDSVTFSDKCRVYELGGIFLKIEGKYYHIYSKGVNYGSHSLRAEEIPKEWTERLRRTVKYKNVKIESVGYVQDSLKWIEINVEDSYLYICTDIFEKINLFRSVHKIENPMNGGNDTFDKNLEKIDFIN